MLCDRTPISSFPLLSILTSISPSAIDSETPTILDRGTIMDFLRNSAEIAANKANILINVAATTVTFVADEDIWIISATDSSPNLSILFTISAVS